MFLSVLVSASVEADEDIVSLCAFGLVDSARVADFFSIREPNGLQEDPASCLAGDRRKGAACGSF